jgi:hypothetical protein
MVKIMNYEFKMMNSLRSAVDAFRFHNWSRRVVVAGVLTLSFIIYNSQFITALAQQPQVPDGTPLYSVNAKYVNGMAPGYWATKGSGLTLSLSAGTAYCGNAPAPVSYPGGSLALTASATNYIYLDPANNCAPAAGTSAFEAGQIPIAKVVTGASSITSITDARTWFQPQPCVTGSAGDLHCSSLGTNQNISLTPSGSGATVITNLADKGGQVFNVRAYGAKGDGTTEDSSAINTAISAAAAAHGEVLFPPGTYLVNSLNSFPGNINLRGVGGEPTILKYTGTGVGFLWSGVGSDRVIDLTFDCTTGPASTCVKFADTSSNGVAYNHFDNTPIRGGTYCLEMNSSSVNGILWNTFTNFILSTCGTHALYITHSGSGFVNENLFQSGVMGTTTNTQQIAYVNGNLNLFQNVDASFASGAGGAGFAFAGAIDNTIIGGDLESDTNSVTFDATSTHNKVFNASGVAYVSDSATQPSGNDVITSTWNRFTQLQFPTPALGSPSTTIEFPDTGNLGPLYLYNNSGIIRLGRDTTGSADKFMFNMGNGAFATAGPIATGGHLNQTATGNFAGTCVFAASTTCSVTYSSAFGGTPLVFLQPVNPGSVTFTLTSSSNTGFTVTASATNSSTVNWEAIGNPN